MNSIKHRYILKITPLTAVHIGTGLELTPFNYVIKLNKNRTPTLYRFIPGQVISFLSSEQKKELEKLSESGNILPLRKFLYNNFKAGMEIYSLPVSKDIAKSYVNNLQSERNQLIINEMYRKGDIYSPVIPGSSLKGAIRTAVLNKKVREKTSRGYAVPKINKEIQKQALNYKDAKDDPFRAVSISDCVIKKRSKNQVVSNLFIYKNTRGENSRIEMQMTYELIRGKLFNGSAIGGVELLIDNPLIEFPPVGNWEGIKVKLNIKEIADSCNKFYKDAFKEEFNKHYGSCNEFLLKNNLEMLEREIDDIGSDSNKISFLLRVGRFSQVECVTLEEPYRSPFNKKGYGKTRTLARYNDLEMPLGWVRVDVKKAYINGKPTERAVYHN